MHLSLGYKAKNHTHLMYRNFIIPYQKPKKSSVVRGINPKSNCLF